VPIKQSQDRWPTVSQQGQHLEQLHLELSQELELEQVWRGHSRADENLEAVEVLETSKELPSAQSVLLVPRLALKLT